MAEAGARAADLPARIGRHDVLAYIATGGMAELFLGRETTGRPVVIKRILPHLARQRSFVSMFIDEARIGQLIRHPNLVEIHELGQVGNDLFLVMEYLAGENLAGTCRRLISRQEELGYALAAHVVAEACLGLHAAHELTDESGTRLEVVHRDVSPQNIFVTYSGEVKVLDFGIATAAHRLTQTATGQLKGKFSYMSPEQCRGETLDAQSDIFSLGVVLYELTMLRRLFKKPNELMVLKAVTEDPIPRPTRERTDFPKQLESIILRALSREKDRRFATAKDMHDALRAAITSLGIWADPRVALQETMQRMFVDRIAEKRVLLSQVRLGTDIGQLPSIEVDENVDVPQVTAQSISKAAYPEAPRSRSRAPMWIALLLTLLAGGAGVYVWQEGYFDGDTTSAREAPPTRLTPEPVSAPPPPPATPPPPPTAPALAPVPAAPAEIVISIDSKPSGAAVLLDGNRVGNTPIELRLKSSTTEVTIELQLKNHDSFTQTVTLDRDQTFVLALAKAEKRTPVRPPNKKDDGFRRFD